MVQFYQKPDPGAAFGQGFADAFGEGLRFKINKSRFQDALAPIDKKMESGGYESMGQMMMDLVKNVGPLPGGTQMISQMAPALMQNAQSLGIGKMFGGEETQGQQTTPQSPTDITTQPVQQSTKDQPIPGRGATPKQIANVQQQPVQQQQRQQDASQLQSFDENIDQIAQKYGVRPNISKYNPLAPAQPPKLLPPLSQEERGNIIKENRFMGFEKANQAADMVDAARQRQNQFLLENYKMDDQYKTILQNRTDTLAERAISEIKPTDDVEKDVLNRVSQDIAAGYENPSDAMPQIRQTYNRFRKVRDDTKNQLTLGSKEIAKSITSGEPLGKDVKRRMSALRENAKIYKEFGIEDKFREEMAQSGWPEVMTELTLNPLSKDQTGVLDQISESKTPKFEMKGKGGIDMRPGAHMKPFQNVPVPPIQIIENQTKELKPQLWGVMNSSAMKEVSPEIIRQAFMEKGYDWRSFGNAFSELLDDGEISLGQFQKAVQSDILRPPNEGLDSILEKGFFNGIRNAIFGLK